MADTPIPAQGITVQSLFMGRRFGLVYYQREYSWSRSDVKVLITDLHDRFDEAWMPGHNTRDALRYPPYFLGSIVYYEEDGTTYVVDGQQRITTLHLLLIHLFRLLREQGAAGDARHMEALVRPNRGDQTFAIDIPEHAYIYEALMAGEPVNLKPDSKPTEKQLVGRGRDLVEDFPADLCGDALVPFVTWLLERVCLAGIRADGRDHGWQIFETTNDRGVRLGPIDLLKSRLLAQAKTGQDGLNRDWREMLSRLNDVGPRVPSDFIKSYLLATHVRVDDATDRKQASDAFHEWFRLNSERVGLRTPLDYTEFIRNVCAPLGKHYSKIAYAAHHWDSDWSTVFYNEHNNVPHHLTAVLAALRPDDTDPIVHKKARLIANFLDLLLIRRLLNNKSSDENGMEDDALALITVLRKCPDVEAVQRALAQETSNIDYGLGRMTTFALTPGNRPQVRYLLARLTAHTEEASGRRNNIQTYLDVDRPYEIHQIWGTQFERHSTEAGNRKATYESLRNRLGSLLLLSPADCIDLKDEPYPRQLAIFQNRHVLAASLDRRLHEDEAFKKWANDAGLTPLLRPYPRDFPKAAIEQRQVLYEKLCATVWDPGVLGLQLEQTERPATSAPRRTINRSRKPADTLIPLIDASVLNRGEALIATRVKVDYSATVGPQGEVVLPTGEIFASPNEAGAFVLGQKSCNGWGFWNVVRTNGRVSLKDVRSQAKEAGLLD